MTMRLIAAAGFALASFSCNASAATVVGGSGLLISGYASQLESWLDATPLYDGSLQFTNIFTRQAGDLSYDFHAATDGKGPTISILSVVGNNGASGIIGGFNPQSWKSNFNYSITNDLADRTAFIFNLTTSVLLPQISGQSGRFQTFNDSTYGPTFGGGHDLYSNLGLGSGYLNPVSYGNGCGSNCLGQVNLLGGTGAALFNINGLEVFTISEMTAAVPEPSTWAMMILGFAGVGYLGYRRQRAPVAAAA